MTTIRDIDTYISALAGRELSEAWDNDGVMLCGNADTSVNKALVCLEVNTEAIKRAVQLGAKLIITHHPFIFRPLKSIRGEYFTQISLLMQNGISVLSYHTRLDKARGGVNDVLAQTLGLKGISEYGEFLRVGELECDMTGEEFAKYLQRKLNCGTMKAYFEKGAKIRRVSVCGGAGKDFLGEAAEISDAYVSSDFSHNTFIDAKELGVAVFDAGHYYTENPVTERLCSLLEKSFADTSFENFDVGCPFFTV